MIGSSADFSVSDSLALLSFLRLDFSDFLRPFHLMASSAFTMKNKAIATPTPRMTHAKTSNRPPSHVGAERPLPPPPPEPRPEPPEPVPLRTPPSSRAPRPDRELESS